ncbi:MAG: hypothetical protein GVY20_05425 [Bacteroidetes bacterium]|jgi:predicted secreted acid phosphatase|nr:hypothetical protein [Bacteroidota bacterium]
MEKLRKQLTEFEKLEINIDPKFIMVFDNFPADVKGNITPKERAELLEEYSEHWGRKWFILSNPTYGPWEGILSDPKSDYFLGYQRIIYVLSEIAEI